MIDGEGMLERAKEKMVGSRKKPGREKEPMIKDDVYMGDVKMPAGDEEGIIVTPKIQLPSRKLRDN